MDRLRIGALLLALGSAACSSPMSALTAGAPAVRAPSVSSPSEVSRRAMCGTSPTPPATYEHVIWIWMENHSYDQIVGSSQAPYTNHTLIAGCGLATDYHNISHPSLPNYIAATSGLGYGALQPFKPDCDPSGSCTTPAESIFAQVGWKAYEESMPKDCDRHDAGTYAVRHNPPPYYTTLKGCGAYDVPYTQLAADLTAGTLPAFSFVTPNLCDDTHDCGVGVGDAWLKAQIPGIVSSAAYRSGTTAVFITWDEGEGAGGDHCAEHNPGEGCHVATIVLSPYTVPGTASGTAFNHYSLLRTTEEMLGIGSYLGKAASATSMRAAFNL